MILLAAGALCLLAALALARDQARLSAKLIRLHVVAASDSAADQAQKLAVRDRLLAQISERNWQSRGEAEAWLRENLSALEAAGSAALPPDTPFAVTLAEERFPARDYDSFSLPAGSYLSLRAVIGAGAGHNWWCVVYPTLCSTLPVESAARSGGLTEGEIALITQKTPAAHIRFKLYDWLADLFQDA